jgi:hypothetical protein
VCQRAIAADLGPGYGPARQYRGAALTVTRSLLALLGLTVATLQPPVLTHQAVRVLRPVLRQQGFDLERPIRVRELEHEQGFPLEQ